jgi:hypothetical protein
VEGSVERDSALMLAQCQEPGGERWNVNGQRPGGSDNNTKHQAIEAKRGPVSGTVRVRVRALE